MVKAILHVNSRNVVIVAAHPDDEVLGCGGTISKLIKSGHRVIILYLSSGDSQEERREKEALRVCDFFQISSHYFLRLKGPSFKVSSPNIQKVIRIFKLITPTLVYINHDQESDYEHRIAFQLVTESYWRYNHQVSFEKRAMGIVLYEVHRLLLTHNLVEDISAEMDTKMKAMSLYHSQLKSTRWDLAIKGLNQYRGRLHNQMKFAEVFQVKILNSILPYLHY